MTKEERQLFEDLKREVKELRDEKSIYCDPEWITQIATFLIGKAKSIGGNMDIAYEIAYESTCERFNITEEGLRKIHLACGRNDNVARLKKVRFLKEEIMNRPVRLCPFYQDTEVVHMKKNNMQMADVRHHNRVDYDIHRTMFGPCIKTECMMYDEATGTCKRN